MPEIIPPKIKPATKLDNKCYMKKAVQVFSYIVGVMMFLGALSLSSEGEMDVYTFLAFGLILTQTVLTLVYVHDKK